ncbi:MFS transporter [Rothia nasimurium]|uniref:MFS transporter n=1 Tax=Rothia nasimurium TaxID=85336 RepID=UPI003B9E3038
MTDHKILDQQAELLATKEEKKTPGKSALAAFLGSTLEYYDFVLYGAASALVFNKLFFPTGDPVVATMASLATFGVAYIMRPIGGLVMSHVGDKMGRKLALMITLIIMGVASFAIGLLPTYEAIGYWATALLVLCRVAQGFSAGAEAAGSSTLTMEHSPEGRRAFFTSFTMAGCSAGNVLASVVFFPFMLLPEEQLMSWGWRVPFLLSAVVLLVAYFVRKHLEETPSFDVAKETGAIQAVPAMGVLKTQGLDVARVFLITFYSVIQSVTMVYALTYATQVVGLERSTMLLVNAAAMTVSMIMIPLCAIISDRVGRKPVLLFGAVGCIITIYFYFQAITDANWPLIFALCIINQGIFYSCWNAVWTVYFPEMFAAPVRFTGMAMGNQVGLVLVGFAPSISTWIQGNHGWIGVVAFVVVSITISCLTILTTRETAFTPIHELGAHAVKKQVRQNRVNISTDA